MSTARPAARAGLVTIAGGVLMVLGTLLPFLSVSGGLSGIPAESVQGLDTPDGQLFLFVGLAIIAFGVVVMLTRGVWPRVLGVLSILAGAFMLVAGIVDLTGLGEEGLRAIADEAARQTPGVTSDQVLEVLQQVGVSVDASIGLYIVLVGSAVAVVGGLWAAFTRTPAPAPPPPPAPGEPTGYAPSEPTAG